MNRRIANAKAHESFSHVTYSDPGDAAPGLLVFYRSCNYRAHPLRNIYLVFTAPVFACASCGRVFHEYQECGDSLCARCQYWGD